MTDLDALSDLMDALTPPMLAPAKPRKCRRHEWFATIVEGEE